MKAVKLITESSYQYNVKKDGNDLYIEGIFSSAEVLNNNCRIYPKRVLEREIDRIMESVKNRTCFGELAHPETPELQPDRVAILTTDLWWEDNNVMGRAKVLSETPMGNIARVLITEGNLGISSRGLGTVDEKTNYVNEDFKLLRWDLVGEPSNPGSWVRGIYEGKTFTIPIDTPSITLEEARKQYVRHIWQVLEDISKSL